MSHPCFGRVYPNAPGATRGGCRGRPPGQVMWVLDQSGFFAEWVPGGAAQCEFLGTANLPGGRDCASTWANGSDATTGKFVKLLKFYDPTREEWFWQVEFRFFATAFDPRYWVYERRLVVNDDCTDLITYSRVFTNPNSPPGAPLSIQSRPVRYTELEPGYCHQRP